MDTAFERAGMLVLVVEAGLAGAGLLTRLQPRRRTPALSWDLTLRLTLMPTRALSLSLTSK